MGALTYIGNAPNFMVSSIASENGIEMPGFFGYLLRAGADAPALAARHRYRPLPNARLPLFDCAKDAHP